MMGDGCPQNAHIAYELKRAISDCNTHVLFESHDFIARLAALVPRSRGHLIRYHGLFAPNARQRQTIVAARRYQLSGGGILNGMPREDFRCRYGLVVVGLVALGIRADHDALGADSPSLILRHVQMPLD